MMIQPLSASEKAQPFGQVSQNNTTQKTNSNQPNMLGTEKNKQKGNAVFQQAAYVVEFSDQVNKMKESQELSLKVNAMEGGNAATIKFADETLEYLNKTDSQLSDMEFLVKIAADEDLNLTKSDRAMIQKELEAIKSDMKSNDMEFEGFANKEINNFVDDILKKHAQQVADGMTESEASKDAAQALSDMLSGKNNMDLKEQFEQLSKLDGLDSNDKKSMQFLKENIIEDILSKSEGLSKYLLDVYTVDVSTLESSQQGLEKIKLAREKVQQNREELYTILGKSSEAVGAADIENDTKELEKFKGEMENWLKEQSKNFYKMEKNNIINQQTGEVR